MGIDVKLGSFWHPKHKIRKSRIGNQLPVRHERSNPRKPLKLVFHHAESLLFEVFACFLGKPGNGMTGLNERPDIVLRRTRTFLTSDNAYQGVVVLQISGVMRAVSIRAELIYERYRITDIVLI